MKSMGTVREPYALPEPILAPGVKNFLGSFGIGRLGLRVGRATRAFFRKSRDPIQHKIWARQFVLPLRNAILWNRPLKISIAEIPLSLVPRGSTAADTWAGLRCESREVSFILNVLEPGMIFFDVGANAGLFAISAAKKIGGNGVFAFEPCSSTCDLLRQNLSLNCLPEVHVIEQALGDSEGTGVLQLNERGRGGLNTLGWASHPHSRVIGRENVRITTADQFVQEHNILHVDVMKADIEGAELLLFRGARELLKVADAPLILYEGFGFLTRGFGYHPVEILWFLESCGYTLFSFNSETGEVLELRPDYLFDSMVVAAKPAHPAYRKLQASVR